jgi:uncharacterized protein
LQRMMQREPPIVKVLPRQPGTKEARYMHLLSGDLQEVHSPTIAQRPEGNETLMRLENEIRELRQEVADLKEQLVNFRKAFE